MLLYMTYANHHASSGLGLGRACSAQGVLMRSHTMPLSFTSCEYNSNMTVQGGSNYCPSMGEMGMDMDGGYNIGRGMVENDPSLLQ